MTPERLIDVAEICRQARNEALEEAARVAEGFKIDNMAKIENPAEWPFKWTENLLDQVAAAIRALKNDS